ncbi:hypothetical protein [Streptomyces sp. NPDC021212]|uniref:hypothetical protein n=1 Tax=Streptomyces sp. NPDC021212 TaxID=3365118 RepID=UPI00379E61EF
MTYCRDTAEIHDALIHLVQEGRRRIRLAEQLGDDVLEKEPWRVGPRLVILLEEVNATMAQLKRYWERIRESGDAKVSPAVDALAEILFMGRAVRLHVLLVAQSATARAIGGPEMRENFATRILVRYTLNAWRMLVLEVSPAPAPTRRPGRVQVVLGGRAQETQVLNLSDAEAREWAMSGVHSSGEAGPLLPKPTTPEPAPVLPVPAPADRPRRPHRRPERHSRGTGPRAAGRRAPSAGRRRRRAAHSPAGAPAAAHACCAALGSRQRPGLPGLGRQARQAGRRTPLPRR